MNQQRSTSRCAAIQNCAAIESQVSGQNFDRPVLVAEHDTAHEHHLAATNVERPVNDRRAICAL
eukprot:6124797-Prymnesium_polylepis.1